MSIASSELRVEMRAMTNARRSTPARKRSSACLDSSVDLLVARPANSIRAVDSTWVITDQRVCMGSRRAGLLSTVDPRGSSVGLLIRGIRRLGEGLKDETSSVRGRMAPGYQQRID